MAVTIASSGGNTRTNDVLGNLRAVVRDVALDSSYPTGGYTITAAQLGLPNTVAICWCEPKGVESHGAVNFTYNLSTGALQAWGVNAEIANATDLHSCTVTVYALGY